MAGKRFVVLTQAGYEIIKPLADLLDGSEPKEGPGAYVLRCSTADFSGPMHTLEVYAADADGATITLWLPHGAILFATDFRAATAPGFLAG